MILMPYHTDVVVLLAMRVMDTDVNPEVIYLISFPPLSLSLSLVLQFSPPIKLAAVCHDITVILMKVALCNHNPNS